MPLVREVDPKGAGFSERILEGVSRQAMGGGQASSLFGEDGCGGVFFDGPAVGDGGVDAVIGDALVALRFSVEDSENAGVAVDSVELAFEFLEEVEGLGLARHESELHLDVKFANNKLPKSIEITTSTPYNLTQPFEEHKYQGMVVLPV